MTRSQMEKEALSAPDVLREQFANNQSLFDALAKRLQKNPPPFAVTIARGSSDHAATFAKYLLETRLGLVTASAAPSVVTVYSGKLHWENALVLGLSQSGQSPDLAEIMEKARRGGAMTVAIVNQTDSPLANAAEYVIPLYAGPELAVAASKTYLATLAALVQFVSTIQADPFLQKALLELPGRLQRATEMDWSEAIERYLLQKNTLVVARGYGFPIAQEAALKFKETTKIHAEAFSGAEILHGPFALVQADFPILLFAQKDAALPGLLELAAKMKQMGAHILLASATDIPESEALASTYLPLPESLHPLCDPLVLIQAFYLMIANLSLARGLSPDAPLNLSKVTRTW